MADSFDAEHDGIFEVLYISLMSLTCMEECWHFLFRGIYNLDLVLVVKNGVSKCTNFGSEIFFIDHVETSDELGELLVWLA